MTLLSEQAEDSDSSLSRHVDTPSGNGLGHEMIDRPKLVAASRLIAVVEFHGDIRGIVSRYLGNDDGESGLTRFYPEKRN